MDFNIHFREMLRVKITHHYFLNEGNRLFADMASSEKQKMLKDYSFGQFLKILPTEDTASTVRGHRMLCKESGDTFSVWIQVEDGAVNPALPFIRLDDDLQLTFALIIDDSYFYNYTDLPLDLSKEVCYFSNKSSEASLKSGFKTIKKGENKVKNKQFSLFGKDDVPDETSTPEIILDLKEQSSQYPSGLLGFIRIYLKNALGTTMKIPSEAIAYQLLFDNRITAWRYHFPDGSIIEKGSYPLTKSGLISVQQDGRNLPNPAAKYITIENNHFFSDVFM